MSPGSLIIIIQPPVTWMHF